MFRMRHSLHTHDRHLCSRLRRQVTTVGTTQLAEWHASRGSTPRSSTPRSSTPRSSTLRILRSTLSALMSWRTRLGTHAMDTLNLRHAAILQPQCHTAPRLHRAPLGRTGRKPFWFVRLFVCLFGALVPLFCLCIAASDPRAGSVRPRLQATHHLFPAVVVDLPVVVLNFIRLRAVRIHLYPRRTAGYHAEWDTMLCGIPCQGNILSSGAARAVCAEV